MDECVVSGYCRQMDATRMVLCERCAGTLEADCAYPDCPYTAECQVATEIRKRQEEN